MSLSKCWLAKCPEFPGTDYLGPEEWQVPCLVSIRVIQATFVSESETIRIQSIKMQNCID